MKILRLIKKLCIFFTILMLVFLFISLFLSYQFFTPLKQVEENREFVVEKGVSASYVADKLHRERIIRNACYFKLLASLTHTATEIKVGSYKIGPHLSIYQILQKMVRGEIVLKRITIPEGVTIVQISEILEREDLVSKQNFLKAVENYRVNIGEGINLEEGKLEGFLYPDTYDFAPGTPEIRIIEEMIEHFQEIVLPEYKKAKGKQGLTLYQIIILASMIEKEAKLPEELPLISAVYHNRLRLGMLLECDATIQYILGKPKELLSYDDLKIESPYNTYIHEGLPLGPIGNPGLASIKAALYPEDVDYLYFVVKGDGSHYFSSSYQEHLKAVEKYKKYLRERDK